MANWGKQPSSRPIATTTATNIPTKAGTETYQLRVFSSAAASIAIGDSSSTSAMIAIVPIGATIVGEYLTVTPGQWYLPGPAMSVTEMT
jgi:hypothetical protein